jgi:hypothetical protein
MADEENERKAALIRLITAAFQNVVRGNGISLHEADVIDCAGYDNKDAKNRVAARRLDTDRRWQDVPDKDIEDYYNILSFLDAEGLRYYVPAYMVWALKHLKTSGSMSSDSIIYTFVPYLNTGHYERQLERFAIFTTEQNKAICGFLRFMSEHSDGFADEYQASQALTGYWNQFCDAEQ